MTYPYVLPLCTMAKKRSAHAKNSYTESLNIEMFYDIISKEFMGGKIPRSIKVDVIREWLRGKSRDQIAKEEEIGTGTVSSIIKEYRQNDTEFDLLRQVAVIVRSEDYSIESFAPLARIREILKRELLPDKTPTGITIAGGQERDDLKTQQVRQESELEKKLESLLQALLVFCFKQKLPIKDFVDDIHDLRRRANRLGVPFENLPSYVKRLEDTVHILHEELKQKRLEKEEALEDYNVTMELLEEYDANRHSFEENKKLREELSDARQERDYYKRRVEGDVANDLADDYNKDWVPENPKSKDLGEGQEEEYMM
ncbi:MAG: hypothetical protein JO297_14290 [Nitrososphaeraceae archaeon]|nr:hypothetical protein [Nitrososphaeraceae archaeon]